MKQTKLLAIIVCLSMLLAVFAGCADNQTQDDNLSSINASSDSNESTAHVHSYGEYVTEIEPSCKTLGKEVATCSCGSKKERTLPFTCHQYSEWNITKPATCSEIGEKVKVCALCGDEVRTSISATGHQFGEWETEKEPNCIQEGNQKRVCNTCGAVESESIPAHNYVESSRNDATCESAGYIEYKCDRCGKKYKEAFGEAAGHNWQSATCTAPKKCKTCGKTDGKALGHTCTSGTCSRCGKDITPKINIELPSTPMNISYRGGYTICKITDITYEFTGKRIDFTFIGEKIFQYSSDVVAWCCTVKLYNNEGFLVESRLLYVDDLNVGDKFKEKVTIYLDDDWTNYSYKLVLEEYK